MSNTPRFFQKFLNKKMLIVFGLGFSSGMPAVLIGSLLKTWLTRENLTLSTIGFMSWVSIGLMLKFLWAPLLDRWHLSKLGRRKSWILVSQIFLAILIALLGSLNPVDSLMTMAIISVMISFTSATQDIAVDAHRREILNSDEMGLGSSMYQYGYRVAMYVTGGVGLGLVGSEILNLNFHQLYFLMAVLMGLCTLITLLAPEPEFQPTSNKQPFFEFALKPFVDLFTRKGAIYFLLFTMLFKFGDAMAGAMLSSYYVQKGFSNQDIAFIAKTIGPAAGLIGLFLGGTILVYVNLYRALWIFGIFQALSTAMFSLLEFTGPQKWALGLVVVFEDLSAALGSAAFVTFLSLITNKTYTATQFALLSSLAVVGRFFLSGFSGIMAQSLGWQNFFYVCAFFAVPGLLLLFKLPHTDGVHNKSQKPSSSSLAD